MNGILADECKYWMKLRILPSTKHALVCGGLIRSSSEVGEANVSLWVRNQSSHRFYSCWSCPPWDRTFPAPMATVKTWTGWNGNFSYGRSSRTVSGATDRRASGGGTAPARFHQSGQSFRRGLEQGHEKLRSQRNLQRKRPGTSPEPFVVWNPWVGPSDLPVSNISPIACFRESITPLAMNCNYPHRKLVAGG